MTLDHDFGYSFLLFSSLLKRGKKKRRINSKNGDQKSCLSARSLLAGLNTLYESPHLTKTNSLQVQLFHTQHCLRIISSNFLLFFFIQTSFIILCKLILYNLSISYFNLILKGLKNVFILHILCFPKCDKNICIFCKNN